MRFIRKRGLHGARPGAAPPEAPKIWGTGAYNTIIFGTTHDLSNVYINIRSRTTAHGQHD